MLSLPAKADRTTRDQQQSYTTALPHFVSALLFCLTINLIKSDPLSTRNQLSSSPFYKQASLVHHLSVFNKDYPTASAEKAQFLFLQLEEIEVIRYCHSRAKAYSIVVPSTQRIRVLRKTTRGDPIQSYQ